MDGDILWTAAVSLGLFSDGIRLEYSGGTFERFPVESYDGATLGLIDSKVLGVAYSSKLGK